MDDRPDTIVVGGGIAGMGVSRLLSREGLDVRLLEAGRALGGLGACFSGPDDIPLDRFYHCILPSDRVLLDLIDEVGLSDQILTTEGGLGFIYEGKSYPLATALDLLRFKPLSFVQRIRLGLLAVTVSNDRSTDSKLDKVTAAAWIRRRVGATVADRVWDPLLRAKFGSAWDRVPALWLRGTLAREKNSEKEVKSTLSQGMMPLIHALHDDLHARGVDVRTGEPVQSVSVHDRGVTVFTETGEYGADKVVLATPVTQAQDLLRRGGVRTHIADVPYDHQGVVCGLFLMDRPLDGYYWTAVVDSGVDFPGVIEMGVLRPPEHAGGYHIVYVTKYVHRTSEAYRADDDTTLAAFETGLKKLYPKLNDGGIRHRWVFRAPTVEPIYSPGYLDTRPPLELIPNRVYLANVHQVYPGVTSWNSSLEIAQRVCDWIVARRELSAAEQDTHTVLADSPRVLGPPVTMVRSALGSPQEARELRAN